MLVRLFLSFSVVVVLLTHNSYGQQHFRDSINQALQAKPTFFVGFHNRNTFILTDRTRLYGIIGGLKYAEKVSFFAGIYGFGRENKTQLGVPNEFSLDSVTRYTSVSNFSVGASYDYLSRGRLSLHLPVQLGIGNARYTFENEANADEITTRNYLFVPVEMGSNALLEVLPWLHLKAGLGYRFHLGAKEARRLNSPYYNLGLAIRMQTLVSQIKTR